MIGWLSFIRKLLVAGALISGVANAQPSGGVFRGEVRDPSNALVPQAKVVIRSNDTGIQVIAALRETLQFPLKAVLITGDTSTAMKELPRDPHLRMVSKPIRAEELLAIMRSLLNA